MSRLSIELSTIPPEGVARRFVSAGMDLGIVEPEFVVVQPVVLDCHFYKAEREVVVQGTLDAAVRLTCSRCAEEFEQALRILLEAVYLPVQEVSSARAKELDEGVTDVYAYTEAVIDITEMARDKLFLAIPLQPHCMGGCRGLCPSCGVNRNTMSCQCAEDRLGSPFELLKGLRFS